MECVSFDSYLLTVASRMSSAGHLAFQCRNHLQIGNEKRDIDDISVSSVSVSDVSSNEDSDGKGKAFLGKMFDYAHTHLQLERRKNLRK